jgi:hypothetical protein
MSCFVYPTGLAGAWIGLTIQHCGNHGAMSTNPLVNNFMGLTDDLIGGSSLMWRYHHQVRRVWCGPLYPGLWRSVWVGDRALIDDLISRAPPSCGGTTIRCALISGLDWIEMGHDLIAGSSLMWRYHHQGVP